MSELIRIEGKSFYALIDSFGAELKALVSKKTGNNYIWRADPAVWGKSAPNLFPSIGAIKDGFIQVDGAAYPMTKHGFARDMIFDVLEKKMDSISFQLRSNEKTLEIYPYSFIFAVSYSFEGDTLMHKYTVYNKGDKDMYYSVGGHTGFSCENGGGTLDDCKLVFDGECAFNALMLDEKRGLLSFSKDFGRGKELKLSQSLFDNDALVFEDIACKAVTLNNGISGTKIRFEYKDFNNLAIWSAKGNNRYVCLEPWVCRTDSVDSPNDLKDKKGIACLSAGGNAEYLQCITVKEQK